MLLTLAWSTLTRHRARTLLAVLGVAVSAAMLLDMVMLATGMRQSFRSLILARGFQLRLAPKGTLPFDTDATIADASSVEAALHADPDVEIVSPVLGGQLHGAVAGGVVTAIALGVKAAVQGDYELTGGREPAAANEVVASEDFFRVARATLGDTLTVAAHYDANLHGFTGRRLVRVVGQARFLYLPAGHFALALPLATLQEMQREGGAARDRASLFMVKARAGANIEAVRARLERALPGVSVVSTETAMQ